MGVVGALWGVAGFLALLGFAVVRLANHAREAFAYELGYLHWIVMILFVLFMAYSEGYKAFQLKYSPRFIARARYLFHHPNPWRVVLAPLFCMGFFHAPRRRVIASVILTLGIVVLVILFRVLPQPWRGVLDAGVVVGLVWGIAATALIGLSTMLGFNESGAVDPEVPADVRATADSEASSATRS